MGSGHDPTRALCRSAGCYAAAYGVLDPDTDLIREVALPAGDVETYYAAGAWHSRVQGEADPFFSGGTKAEQVAKGRDEARRRQVEHIIKNEDGQIAERNSYGHDPRSVPG
ncbi:hypothetical protein Kfla_2203 [Kribbella flavida DSM 17836]|uniref:DUF2188 domain-containing protein n=1 Tax=Kribbella flavida (strain DSM 17836 / JCM 10339 / NBRC 14399) TaxID=479435 RepID=D2PTG7_KRIFD|nr:DUF2188 domain-containing protein [Kribbella flavida]ADB31280.1 hypothetical protein Kfla_2203 [Kribbella flavida DSM 17836]